MQKNTKLKTYKLLEKKNRKKTIINLISFLYLVKRTKKQTHQNKTENKKKTANEPLYNQFLKQNNEMNLLCRFHQKKKKENYERKKNERYMIVN